MVCDNLWWALSIDKQGWMQFLQSVQNGDTIGQKGKNSHRKQDDASSGQYGTGKEQQAYRTPIAVHMRPASLKILQNESANILDVGSNTKGFGSHVLDFY